MTAQQAHGWVRFIGLLLRDRAREHTMELTVLCGIQQRMKSLHLALRTEGRETDTAGGMLFSSSTTLPAFSNTMAIFLMTGRAIRPAVTLDVVNTNEDEQSEAQHSIVANPPSLQVRGCPEA